MSSRANIAAGQIWRDDENRVNYRVVGFAENGWPVVKLVPNGHSHMVNPKWFKVWRCTSRMAPHYDALERKEHDDD
jgi:hypothetical protein